MNRTASHIVFALAIAAVGVPAALPAAARPGPRGPAPAFEELDLDGDGQISRAEMDEAARARFAAEDADGDGFLSKDEIVAAIVRRATERAEQMAERMIRMQDDDGDGRISAEERLPEKRLADRMFRRLDDDGDGAVSRAEFEAARQHMARHGMRDRRWAE